MTTQKMPAMHQAMSSMHGPCVRHAHIHAQAAAPHLQCPFKALRWQTEYPCAADAAGTAFPLWGCASAAACPSDAHFGSTQRCQVQRRESSGRHPNLECPLLPVALSLYRRCGHVLSAPEGVLDSSRTLALLSVAAHAKSCCLYVAWAAAACNLQIVCRTTTLY